MVADARSLGQAQCYLSGVKDNKNKELCIEEIAQGKCERNHTCLTMKTMGLKVFVLHSTYHNLENQFTFGPETYQLRTMVAV